MVLGYGRISSKKQEDGNSLDYQKQKISEYCKLKELQINEVLAELNIKRIILNYNKKIRDEFGPRSYQDEIDYIVTYEKRNNFIANLTLDQEGNTLVLFNYVEKHGKPLFELINNKADEKRKIFFVSSFSIAILRNQA